MTTGNYKGYREIICVILILLIFGTLSYTYTQNENVGGTHVCDWQACCTGTDYDHAFVCDGQGCPWVIPNWTHPNCEETPP